MGNLVTIHSLDVHIHDIGMHTHNLWELVYYTSGAGQVVIDGELYAFNAHDFVIIPPNVEHQDWSGGDYKVMFCSFFSNHIPSGHGFRLFHDNEHHLIMNVLQQIQYVYLQQASNWSHLADALHNVVLQYIHSYSPSVTKSPIIEEMEAVLIANISNANFNINDALESFYLNNAYLRNLFTKEIGMSPLQFLTYRRIELAKQLLCSSNYTNQPINYIARLCGFKDPYYFSRIFKKETGLSPKNWKDDTSPIEPPNL